MPLLNLLERRRQLLWSISNYLNLMLHGIADAERNLGFYGSPESAYPKGKDFFTQNKGSTFCRVTSREMHRKGVKKPICLPCPFPHRFISCCVPQEMQLLLGKLARGKLCPQPSI